MASVALVQEQETTPDRGRKQSNGQGSLSLAKGDAVEPQTADPEAEPAPVKPRKPPATWEEAMAYADSLEDGQIHCRDVGHAWRAETAKWNPQVDVFDRTWICPNCGLAKFQMLSRYGELLDSGYDYKRSPGYLRKGLGKLTGEARNALRLDSTLRITSGKVPRGLRKGGVR